MTTLPAKYEAARRALAACRSVDEVKDIRDKATAMAVYAKQAKDRELINHATEIRLRAEIRAGEMLREMTKRGERTASEDTLARGRSAQPRGLPTLKDLGISKTQSSHWLQLAALREKDREIKIAEATQRAEKACNVSASPKSKPPARDPLAVCITIIRAAIARARRTVTADKLSNALRELGIMAVGGDVGASSAGELARLNAYIEDLECKVSRLEQANATSKKRGKTGPKRYTAKNNSVNEFSREIGAFWFKLEHRIRSWLKESPIEGEAKEMLMKTLYTFSDGLARLAQEVDGR